MVQVTGVCPLTLTERPFQSEPELLRDRAAPDVRLCCLNLDPVQVQYSERMIDESPNGAGDDATALVVLRDPVSQLRLPVGAVDVDVSHDPYDPDSLQTDTALESSVFDLAGSTSG